MIFKNIQIVILTAAVAYSATYNVPEDFGSIQGAIDVTVDGDSVIVDPGIYFENINFLGKEISKSRDKICFSSRIYKIIKIFFIFIQTMFN